MNADGHKLKSVDLCDLAGHYTSLRRVSSRELAGPCPRCGGDDRFRVRSDWWFCRQCHPRRGDAIDLVLFLGLARSFRDAVNYLHGGVAATTFTKPAPAQSEAWRSETWQRAAQSETNAAIARLAGREGEPGRAYLRRRGLEPAAWRRYELGLVTIKERAAIAIPWRRPNGAITAIQYRFLEGEGGARFAARAGSSRRGLYGINLLQGHDVLVVTEGELNAVSLWQAVGDLVDCVSIGSESALAQLETVREAREIAARYRFVLAWLDDPARARAAREALVPSANVWPIRSPVDDGHKLDANEMLQAGVLRRFVLDVIASIARNDGNTDELVRYAIERLRANVVEAKYQHPERMPEPLRACWHALRSKLDDLEARRRKGESLLLQEADQNKRERYARRLQEIAREIEKTQCEMGLLLGMAGGAQDDQNWQIDYKTGTGDCGAADVPDGRGGGGAGAGRQTNA